MSSARRLPECIRGLDITLRRWRTDDAEALARAVTESVEHLRPWMPWIGQEPLSLDERRAMIGRWEQEWLDGGDLYLGVWARGCLAGGAGLHHRIAPDGLEIGYWIHPRFTRQGLGTAAARLLTEAALSVPGISHVEIHHDRANKASAGIPRKLGFGFLGEIQDEIAAPAEVGVEWIWRMDQSAWSSAGAAQAGRGVHTSVCA